MIQRTRNQLICLGCTARKLVRLATHRWIRRHMLCEQRNLEAAILRRWRIV